MNVKRLIGKRDKSSTNYTPLYLFIDGLGDRWFAVNTKTITKHSHPNLYETLSDYIKNKPILLVHEYVNADMYEVQE